MPDPILLSGGNDASLGRYGAIEVEIHRGELVESIHSIACAIADPQGALHASWGDPELKTYLRSSAKPFQAIAAVISGAVDAASFTSAELALMCASHAGTDHHVAIAASMLAKIGVSIDDLQCGAHIPYDMETSLRLARAGEDPGELRNNCSGKHIGMLALANHLQAPRAGYLLQEHPVQRQILAILSTMVELPPSEIKVGVDGCSAPNFAMPLRNAALGYARLMDPHALAPDLAAVSRRVVGAMTQHPELVSGDGRFDTELMRITKGRLLSKGGAEGYQCIGIPIGSTGRDQPALGMVLKVLDGDLGHRALTVTVLYILHAIGAIDDAERMGMARFDQRPLRNLRGLAVGEVRISPTFLSPLQRDEQPQS